MSIESRIGASARGRSIAALIVLVLLVGAGAWWVSRQTSAPSADLAQIEARIKAEGRWQARPFAQYDLLVTWESPRRGRAIQRYRVGASDDPLTGSERTIEDYFGLIAFHQAGRTTGCDPTVGACAMAYTRSVQVHYDERLGYPAQIELTSTSHPDWGSLDFWPWFWVSGAWQSCANLLCSSTAQSVVTIDVIPVAADTEESP